MYDIKHRIIESQLPRVWKSRALAFIAHAPVRSSTRYDDLSTHNVSQGRVQHPTADTWWKTSGAVSLRVSSPCSGSRFNGAWA